MCDIHIENTPPPQNAATRTPSVSRSLCLDFTPEIHTTAKFFIGPQSTIILGLKAFQAPGT